MSNVNKMNLFEIMKYVDMVRPSAFVETDKLKWFNEVEGLVQTEIMGLDPYEIVYHTTAASNNYAQVPKPYARLYALYIVAMIDLANGEYEKYRISSSAFNEAMQSYAKWYIRNGQK